jgi:hypothetical protein
MPIARRFGTIVFLVWLFTFATELVAQDSLYVAPGWTLNGSVGAGYTDNVRYSRANTIEDIGTTYSGRTAGGLYYETYALGLAESFFDRQSSDSSLYGAGGTLSQVLADRSVLGVNFEPKFNYRDFYLAQTGSVYDLSLFWTKSFPYPEQGLIITPRFVVGNRWSDIAAAERWWLDARLIVTKKLVGQWSVLSVSRAQYHAFPNTGTPIEPHDAIYSQTLNLQYEVPTNSKNWGMVLSSGVSFTARQSNVAAREFKRWGVGPNIDFKIIF